MDPRKAREKGQRRVLLVGVGASIVLHGVVFGALSFQTADSPGSTAAEAGRQAAPFEVVALEVVDVREVPEVEPPDVAATDRPVVVSPAPEDLPEPTSSSMAAAASAAEVTTLTVADLMGSTLSSASLAMRPTAQRNIPGAFTGLAIVDPHAGHDHGDEEEEGEGFWSALGNAWGKVGMGTGGGKVCRPPVVIRLPAFTPSQHSER